MFPSIISTFPIVSPTDRLNSPSHSTLHNSLGSVLTQVQTIIGLSTSSAVGTLMYDVRSPSSNGGGHIQSANKGGTGQTNFTKGDILVAQSASVISKLAVGADGLSLVADSTTPTGTKWDIGAPATFTTTSVFSGTSPSSFTDLNLSSVIGVAQRMVMLKASTSAGSKLFVFKPNGDATEYYGAAATGANAVVTGDASAAVLAIVKTDSAGIIEWRTTGAETGCIISVQAYW